ncbi:MAG: hypothetical protein AAF518_28095, partial [Spirochaetota bacterium]
MRILYTILLLCYFTSCTGSTENSLKEEQLLWQRLFDISLTQAVSLKYRFGFVDDRRDTSVASFELFSGTGSTLYQVALQSGASISIDKFEYSLANLPILSRQPLLHTEELVTSDSGTKLFTVLGQTYTGFLSSNANVDAGYVYYTDYWQESRAIHSQVNSVVLHIASANIPIQITSSGTSKTLTIRLSGVDVTFSPNCVTEFRSGSSYSMTYLFAWQNIFKDNSTSVQYLLESLYSLSSGSEVNS